MNKCVSKIFGIIFLLLELAVIPNAVQLMLNRHLSALPPIQIVVLSMTFGSIFLCIIMSYSAMSEQENYPKQTFLFELTVFLCCIAPMTDLCTRALDAADRPALNMAVNTVFYMIGINISFVIMLYEYVIIDVGKKPLLRRNIRIASVLMIVDSIAIILNIKFGFFFVINEKGMYQSAPTFWLSYIPPVLIIAMIVLTALKEMSPGRQKRTFMFFWVFAIAASVLQMWREELTLQYTGYTLTIATIYLNVQSELGVPHKNQANEEE